MNTEPRYRYIIGFCLVHRHGRGFIISHRCSEFALWWWVETSWEVILLRLEAALESTLEAALRLIAALRLEGTLELTKLVGIVGCAINRFVELLESLTGSGLATAR